MDSPKWEEVYEDATKPLFVDIGCAAGRFSLLMATSKKWYEYDVETRLYLWVILWVILLVQPRLWLYQYYSSGD